MIRAFPRGAWIVLAVVAVMSLEDGCGGAPRVGSPVPGGASVEPDTYAGITNDIIEPSCSACHAGSPPPSFPELDQNGWYQATVGEASQQLPTMSLITAGDPDKSYLVLKLRGTQGLAGGGGERMPIGEPPLDEPTEAGFEAWITNGANR